ncbi:hypothetical protein ACMFMF_000150 [Clarireedia jacksonii]
MSSNIYSICVRFILLSCAIATTNASHTILQSMPLPTATPLTNTTTTATPTTSSTHKVATKTAVPDCHYRGLPGLIADYIIEGTEKNVADELECQNHCSTVSECLSYELWGSMCLLYNVTIFSDPARTGIDLVIPSLVGDLYWSDRFPEDGSGFCFGDGGEEEG